VQIEALADEVEILDDRVPMELTLVAERANQHHPEIGAEGVQVVLMGRVDTVRVLRTAFIVQDGVECLLEQEIEQVKER
jgi:hypothetical protein